MAGARPTAAPPDAPPDSFGACRLRGTPGGPTGSPDPSTCEPLQANPLPDRQDVSGPQTRRQMTSRVGAGVPWPLLRAVKARCVLPRATVAAEAADSNPEFATCGEKQTAMPPRNPSGEPQLRAPDHDRPPKNRHCLSGTNEV